MQLFLSHRRARKSLAIVAAASIALAGCAQHSSTIQPIAASSSQFDFMTCPQLVEEAQRIGGRAQHLAGEQDGKFILGAAVATVGLLVFWPALVALPLLGNDAGTAELSQRRGEMIALQQASERKRCGIAFQKSPS